MKKGGENKQGPKAKEGKMEGEKEIEVTNESNRICQ